MTIDILVLAVVIVAVLWADCVRITRLMDRDAELSPTPKFSPVARPVLIYDREREPS